MNKYTSSSPHPFVVPAHHLFAIKIDVKRGGISARLEPGTLSPLAFIIQKSHLIPEILLLL